MELIRGIHSTRQGTDSCVLTIGAFDGLHLGHQAVLRHLIDCAVKAGLPSVVVTLEPLPREYFSPLQAPARLMSFREKYEGLRAIGIDRVLLINFNNEMRHMEAEEFITRVFVKYLRARHIVVGDDLRFGHDGKGDFGLLNRIGREHGFTVEDTATLQLQDERVSSTRIRQLLEAGDFAGAEAGLGRPYGITGKVVYGKQLGREIGVPTANVQLHRLRAAMSGVYAVRLGVRDDGDSTKACKPSAMLPAVANVGTRPTINDLIQAILEVHVLDFHGDLYGKRVDIVFEKKIREEHKFESLDQLKQQIYQDIDVARDYFTSVGTGG